jgi:threonine dehydrogenase-like Zn-dependent dehydrogenase
MPRRLAITGPYVVEVLTYTDPALEANQVLVKTEIASGKHGTTTGMFDGSVFRGQRFDQQMRLFIPKEPEAETAPAQPALAQPRKPENTGTIGVGVVTQVGAQVKRWKKGDRVFGWMDVRETNVCAEDRLYELGGIDRELALCMEPAYVSLHCIRESNVRYGDTVAIVGLGAIGLLALRMARQAGAERVFVVDPLPRRRAWALKNGADAAFDPREGDPAIAIHEATAKRGVDVAIEVSGSYPALNTALRSARICGTVCSAGFYQGEAHGIFLGREWHHNRLNIVVPHGCGWGHPPRDYPGWTEQRAQDTIVSMMRQGFLTAPGIIEPIVPIERGQEVFSLMRDDPDKLLRFAVRFA